RSKRDWSSDVCSSDLEEPLEPLLPEDRGPHAGAPPPPSRLLLLAGAGRASGPPATDLLSGSRIRGRSGGASRPSGRISVSHGREIGRASCRERGEMSV